MWLCRKTMLLFHEPTLLPDEDAFFRHDATQFRVQETLLFPGTTLFRHENTCFRGESSRCEPDQPASEMDTPVPGSLNPSLSRKRLGFDPDS